MDANKLIEILRATMDPNQREAAEKQLEQVHKIIGFAPSLLQVVMMNTVELPVRQAGVIYLKNMVAQFWQDKEQEPGKPLIFTIHEQDRAMIRDSIVDALVYAADLIRVQLAVCVSNIVKYDFPGKWTGIVDKISVYLQMNDTNVCMGSLLCLYQLVKNFEYKNSEERSPLNEAMNMLLPMIYQRCVQLLPDPSEVSALLQKQILKIFFALIQYFLPLNLITRDVFSQWMELLRNIVGRPIPEDYNGMGYTLNLVDPCGVVYGSPDGVAPEYQEFSKYYLKTYTAGILEVLLKMLDQYRQKVFVSPRVLQLTLNYINEAVSHSLSWKLLKPHMLCIVQDVVFPLMCSTDRDEELWNTDPHEYIRMKFDVFEDFISPVTAAQTLLHSIAKKRKDMLQKSMEFVMSVLTNLTSAPRQIDGALHMVGTVADVLLKRKLYKEEMESILVAYVYPHFQSEHGFMRARACWVMHYFCSMRFQNEVNLITALQLTQNALLSDKELPVKVEAAVALQMLITNQERAEKHLEPHIKPIALELLKILRETENDDLTNVMQKIVCTYTQQLLPIAVEMTQHLAQTFTQVINSSGEDSSDEKTITAMGILNTMDTILSVMEDHKDIMAHLEPIVLNVIGLILTQSVIEFYEESMSLIYSLSSNTISSDMWKVFELMYQTFLKDGFDFFTDMMPALHNFVRVDTQAFVSNENHLLAIFNMCKATLNGEGGEDAECHAAKLLEVVILQCKGMIDQCIPSFVELVLGRLTREVKTSELRTMCLQVVIAALYYNPILLYETLEKIFVPNSTDAITTHFISQWIHDTDCFLGLHDRKMCVVGMCSLISTPSLRSKVNNEVVQKVVPSMLLLFDGLKRAYAYKAQEEEGESDDEDEEDYDPDVLGSDEDDVNEEYPELSKVSREIKKKSPFPVTSSSIVDDDEATDDEEYEEAEETALEGYTTPLDDDETTIDEYIIFKEVMNGLKTTDPNWYNILTSHLTAEQQRAFEEVMVLADQRKAAAESKRIEKSGGYVFQNQTVPTSFNFGGTPLS
ncbi:importin-7 [Trichonephila inaurata madagascariensis]|uniref:Importin-7 n=1 Tax=Trichonephila inaurata madagascariensis TaxID=2747483 RepID=A0A8X7C922_9ARAC|nr:importin-7 [Trichonephila inaurata madagascariensis]